MNSYIINLIPFINKGKMPQQLMNEEEEYVNINTNVEDN